MPAQARPRALSTLLILPAAPTPPCLGARPGSWQGCPTGRESAADPGQLREQGPSLDTAAPELSAAPPWVGAMSHSVSAQSSPGVGPTNPPFAFITN